MSDIQFDELYRFNPEYAREQTRLAIQAMCDRWNGDLRKAYEAQLETVAAEEAKIPMGKPLPARPAPPWKFVPEDGGGVKWWPVQIDEPIEFTDVPVPTRPPGEGVVGPVGSVFRDPWNGEKYTAASPGETAPAGYEFTDERGTWVCYRTPWGAQWRLKQ